MSQAIGTASATTLAEQARALLSGQRDRVANSANLSALLFMALEDVNWAGFYFLNGQELILGPFQGKPACVSIPLGQGVCGTAAATRSTQRIADVDQFDGHIACDPGSRAEIVIPLLRDGHVLGVLDIDSETPGRFSTHDQYLLEKIADIFVASID